MAAYSAVASPGELRPQKWGVESALPSREEDALGSLLVTEALPQPCSSGSCSPTPTIAMNQKFMNTPDGR